MSRKWLSYIPYAAIAIVVLVTIIFVSTLSQSANTISTSNASLTRDSLSWDTGNPPGEMKEAWRAEGYTDVFDTPGTIIASTSNGVYRLDSETGDRMWGYERDGAHLCDAIEADGQVAAIFNPGHGCTDIILLDGATGQYVAQAQYGTDSQVARLVYGRKQVAIVTPDLVRVLRSSDLVPKAMFGTDPAPRYPSDQPEKNCNVSDAVLGPKSFAVAAQCEDDDTYKVYVVNNEPEESTTADIVQTIDSGSKNSLTLPVMSLSMIIFVVQDNSPTAYVWQLDKEFAEVAAFSLQPNQIGYTYDDYPMFGYTWRIGDWVRYRQGSEDLSKGIDITSAMGAPMIADRNLLVPVYDGIAVANFDTEKQETIKVDGLPSSTSYAFSGRTIAALDVNGTVIGFN